MSIFSLSYAQNLPVSTSGNNAAEAPDKYDAAEDWMIDEAQAFYHECEADYRFNNHYNCECLAGAFLDTRMEVGAKKPKSSIVLAIRNTCRDATFAAGRIYSGCMASGTILPQGAEIDAYCECFATEYARVFENSTVSINSKTSRKTQVRAHGVCRKKFRSASYNN